MHVEIISNQEEVQSIYLGMDISLKSHRKSHLLLDPNGESMEFILCRGTYAYLEDSHPLCLRRLVARFPHKDPIAPREIAVARQYFRLFCCCLFGLHGGCTVSKLMSSSGVFHTLFELHKQVNAQPQVAYYPNMKRMSIKQFHRTYKAVLKTPSHTWLKNKTIDPLFLPLMPLSVIFLDALIRRCELGEIVIPSHSPQTGLFVHLWQKFKKYRLFQ
jgi:exopolyphosphatase/pppGpp-phosphohydrolase